MYFVTSKNSSRLLDGASMVVGKRIRIRSVCSHVSWSRGSHEGSLYMLNGSGSCGSTLNPPTSKKFTGGRSTGSPRSVAIMRSRLVNVLLSPLRIDDDLVALRRAHHFQRLVYLG